MRAANFVIQDLQAWHGVRVGIIAQDEIPHFLIGVCALGAWFHFDEAGKNRTGAVVEGVEIEEIARCMWGDVILKGALVDLAGAFHWVD